MERHAHILDYLPNGRQTEHGFHREPLALAIGEDELKLLELVPRVGVKVGVRERVPMFPEPGKVAPVDHVRRRLGFDELTSAAKTELPTVLDALVLANPSRFLRVFNEAEAVSRRFHLLELLPGIGKKTMQSIVEERKRGPFQSFEDLETRLGLHHPERLISARIEEELRGASDKYHLFVAP